MTGARQVPRYTLIKAPPRTPSLVVKYFSWFMIWFLILIAMFLIGSVSVSADTSALMQVMIVCLGVLGLVSFIAALVVQTDKVGPEVRALWQETAQRVELALGWCQFDDHKRRGGFALMGQWGGWSVEVVHLPTLGEQAQVYQLQCARAGWSPQAPWVIRRVEVAGGQRAKEQARGQAVTSLRQDVFAWAGGAEGERVGVVVERASGLERAQALSPRWRAVWAQLPEGAQVVIEAASVGEQGEAAGVCVRLVVPVEAIRGADDLVMAAEALRGVIGAWGEGEFGREGALEIARWLPQEPDAALRWEALGCVLTEGDEGAVAEACRERLGVTADVTEGVTAGVTAAERLLCAVTVGEREVVAALGDDPVVGATARALGEMWEMWSRGAGGHAQGEARGRAWSALAVLCQEQAARREAWSRAAQGVRVGQRVALIGFAASQPDPVLRLEALRLAGEEAVGAWLVGARGVAQAVAQAVAWARAATEGWGEAPAKETAEAVQMAAAVKLLGTGWVVSQAQAAHEEAHETAREALVRLILRCRLGALETEQAVEAVAVEGLARLGVWRESARGLCVQVSHGHGQEARWRAEVTADKGGAELRLSLTEMEVVIDASGRAVKVGGQDVALNVAFLRPEARALLSELWLLSELSMVEAVDGQWELSMGKREKGSSPKPTAQVVINRLEWLLRWRALYEQWPKTDTRALLQRLEQEEVMARRLSVWGLLLERCGEEGGAAECEAYCRALGERGGRPEERLLCAAVTQDWQALRALEGGVDAGFGWRAQALRVSLTSAQGQRADAAGRGLWALRALDARGEAARSQWLEGCQGEVSGEAFSALLIEAVGMASERGRAALLEAHGLWVETSQVQALADKLFSSKAQGAFQAQMLEVYLRVGVEMGRAAIGREWAQRLIEATDEGGQAALLANLKDKVSREEFTAQMMKVAGMASEGGRAALLRTYGAYIEREQVRVIAEQALGSSSPELVAAAVILCAHAGLEDAAAEWPRLLYRFGPVVDEAIVQGLGMLKEAECVRPLKELLRHPQAAVQVAALDSLGRRGDIGCVPALREVLDRSSGADPQRGAAEAAILAILKRNGGVGERGALALIHNPVDAGALSLPQPRAHDGEGGAEGR
jgi:hypothetical protein